MYWLFFDFMILLINSDFLTIFIQLHFLVNSISHLTRLSGWFWFFIVATYFNAVFLPTHQLPRYVASSMFRFILQDSYCSVWLFVWFPRCYQKITNYYWRWNLQWFPWWLPYSWCFAIYFGDNRWYTIPVVFVVAKLSFLFLTSVFLNLSFENDIIYLSIKHTSIIDILQRGNRKEIK